jgi:toxin YoeB
MLSARMCWMKSLVFEGNTWEIYEALRTQDKRLHKKLCAILREMLRGDPAIGIGKPEPLRHNLSGLWSRRISHRDRVLYHFDDNTIYIFAIGGHYDDH